jgi:hypothetical protein
MALQVQSWTEKLRFSLRIGLFDQRVDIHQAHSLEILAKGRGKISSSPDAFSMDIRKYVEKHSILGDFDARDWQRYGQDQILDLARSKTITFVRGTPSSSVLHHISNTLNLDPEFILEYYGLPDTFRIRSLPSRTPPVATVRFISLGIYAPAPVLEQGPIQLRAELNSQIQEQYRECLNNDRPGVERCRRINLHDGKFFTVEQQAILVTYDEVPASWSGVWLTDYGTPSSSRPWIPRSCVGVEAQFYPIVPWGQCSMSASDSQPGARGLNSHNFAHPNPFLRAHTDRTFMSEEDRHLCDEDPFMFIADVYDTSALGWMQFFSFLRASFENLPTSPTDQAPRLRSDKELLDRAICYFSETRSLLHHPPKAWQRSKRAKEVATRLKIDYKVLQHEAESLSTWCSEAISIAMSTISIMDSQKSLAEAHRVQLITYLAFLLIPMTFIASCFGMNIQELAEPGSTLRMYFAISVPFSATMLLIPVGIETKGWVTAKFKLWKFKFRGR